MSVYEPSIVVMKGGYVLGSIDDAVQRNAEQWFADPPQLFMEKGTYRFCEEIQRVKRKERS